MVHVLMRLIKFLTRPINKVQYHHITIILIEGEVVIVMLLGGTRERQVVSTVCIQGCSNRYSIPRHGKGKVRAAKEWPKSYGQQITN